MDYWVPVTPKPFRREPVHESKSEEEKQQLNSENQTDQSDEQTPKQAVKFVNLEQLMELIRARKLSTSSISKIQEYLAKTPLQAGGKPIHKITNIYVINMKGESDGNELPGESSGSLTEVPEEQEKDREPQKLADLEDGTTSTIAAADDDDEEDDDESGWDEDQGNIHGPQTSITKLPVYKLAEKHITSDLITAPETSTAKTTAKPTTTTTPAPPPSPALSSFSVRINHHERFSCTDRKTGFYADVAKECQVCLIFLII